MKSMDRKLARVLVLCLVLALAALTPAFAENLKSNAKAKNVILLIADGCGFNCFQATDYYQYGAAGTQVYEKFPFKVAASTYEFEYLDYTPATSPIWGPWFAESGKYVLKGYSTDQFWSDMNYPIWIDTSLGNPLTGWYVNNNTDSASAATAMSTGFKTKDGAIGYAFPLDENGNLIVDAEGKSYTEPKQNIVQYAKSLGKSAGVVSSVYFTHATPAGFVAHNASRSNYAAMGNEMIFNSGIDVIMATGAPDYNDSGLPCVLDSATGQCAKKWSSSGYWYFYDAAGNRMNTDYVGGFDTWQQIREGVDSGGNPFPFSVIRDKSEFQEMAEGDTPARVLGLPKVFQTLQYYRAGDKTKDPYVVPFTPNIPTLEEMSKAALNVLDNNSKGFFLMIEGGAADWANHSYQGGRMIEEHVEFNRTVEAVVDWVQKNSNWGETMVIVTADHETGFIWGPGSCTAPTTAGGSWVYNAYLPLINNGAGVMPGMQYCSPIGWHTNSLVPLFAKGDAARLFNGYADNLDLGYGPYVDNTDIFRVVKYAFENDAAKKDKK